MNIKMAMNSQLLTIESKNQTKQTSRTETESQKWRSHGGLSVWWGRGENWGKSTGNKKHKQQVQNRQGDVKNSVGNGEAKELIYITHGYELRGYGGDLGMEMRISGRGVKGEKSGQL